MRAPIQPVILWNAFAGIVLPFIYIMSIIKLMDIAVRRGFPQDLSRKVIHIAAGSWIWVWPLMDPSHWSYIFNVSIACLWTVLFLVKGLTASPDDPAVRTMTRTGDPKELLRGPLFFTLVMEFVGIAPITFMKFLGVVTMGYLGWGDGLAPYIGKLYGRHRYKILGSEKSVEGSVTMFLAGFIGCLLLYLLVFWQLPTSGTELLWMLLLGIVATIAEALSPKDLDNLIIPAAIIIAYYALPLPKV